MNKYQSYMGGGEITAAQFVMEQFLLLLASQEKTTLPKQFWKLDKYKKLWARHVRSVHAILKEYHVETITKSFKDKRLRRLRSLNKAAAWLWKPVFDEYEKGVVEKLKRESQDIDISNIDITNVRVNNSSTQIDKLLELDN